MIWREAIPASGGFQWFRGMTIEGGVAGPFVHLMDDTSGIQVEAFLATDGHIDILAVEEGATGSRLLHRHGTGSLH